MTNIVQRYEWHDFTIIGGACFASIASETKYFRDSISFSIRSINFAFYLMAIPDHDDFQRESLSRRYYFAAFATIFINNK